MKWTVNDLFRVFEIIFIDKRIGMGSLETVEKNLKSDQTVFIVIFLVLWFLVPVPAFIYVLYRERKFYRE